MLAKAQQKLANHIKNEFRKANVRLSAGQAGILFLLRQKNERPMSELSSILEIDNSAITRIVDRLENAGMVQRSLNPKDRRQYLIKITEKGLGHSKKAEHIARMVNEKIKEGFSKEEIETFKKIISSFHLKFSKSK